MAVSLTVVASPLVQIRRTAQTGLEGLACSRKVFQSLKGVISNCSGLVDGIELEKGKVSLHGMDSVSNPSQRFEWVWYGQIAHCSGITPILIPENAHFGPNHRFEATISISYRLSQSASSPSRVSSSHGHITLIIATNPISERPAPHNISLLLTNDSRISSIASGTNNSSISATPPENVATDTNRLL